MSIVILMANTNPETLLEPLSPEDEELCRKELVNTSVIDKNIPALVTLAEYEPFIEIEHLRIIINVVDGKPKIGPVEWCVIEKSFDIKELDLTDDVRTAILFYSHYYNISMTVIQESKTPYHAYKKLGYQDDINVVVALPETQPISTEYQERIITELTTELATKHEIIADITIEFGNIVDPSADVVIMSYIKDGELHVRRLYVDDSIGDRYAVIDVEEDAENTMVKEHLLEITGYFYTMLLLATTHEISRDWIKNIIND